VLRRCGKGNSSLERIGGGGGGAGGGKGGCEARPSRRPHGEGTRMRSVLEKKRETCERKERAEHHVWGTEEKGNPVGFGPKSTHVLEWPGC